MTADSLYTDITPILLWTVLGFSFVISVAALTTVIVLLRNRPAIVKAATLPATPASAPILRESEKNGRSPEEALIQWSPEMLKQILATELPDTALIVVSNRDP